MNKLTNTRREDIIKAAKFHYNVDGRGSKLDYVRAVICAHNGVERGNLQDNHVMSVLLHDTIDEVLANTGSASKFMHNLVRTHEMNRFMGKMNAEQYDGKNDGLTLLMDEYISAICFLKVTDLRDKSLPVNCPEIEKFIITQIANSGW